MRGEFQGMPCPKCGKKMLHYRDHPHAQGFKTGQIECASCGALFKKKDKEPKNA